MLDLNNCVATSVVLTTATYLKPRVHDGLSVKPVLKPAKNAGKKYFPTVFHLNTKRVDC